MEQVGRDELIGTFESAYDYDKEITTLKDQAKTIGQKKKETLDIFAKEFSIDKKNLNAAYARYKELRAGNAEVEDEDRYTLLAMVDEAFQEEEDSSKP